MSGNYRKPSTQKVHEVLREYNGLIVHFSSVPSLDNTRLRYPDDLKGVISGDAMNGISCSVIRPGDVFTGSDKRKAFGTIGVLVDLLHAHSLATATKGDGGSLWHGTGKRDFEEMDLTVEELKVSLSNRSDHNEWGIRDYRILGIFVAPGPLEIDSSEGIKPYDRSQVLKDFDNQPVFTFEGDRVLQLQPQQRAMAHLELYP